MASYIMSIAHSEGILSCTDGQKGRLAASGGIMVTEGRADCAASSIHEEWEGKGDGQEGKDDGQEGKGDGQEGKGDGQEGKGDV